MKSLLLLSGGIDSIALAHWLRPKVAITIDYGQSSAEKEIAAASFITTELGIDHRIIRTGAGVPGCGTMSQLGPINLSPVPEWWPFRNQYLITIAAMQAVQDGCESIIIGTVKTDRQMMDGSPAFFDACRALLGLQEGSIKLETPASELTSIELVQQSKVPIRLLMVSHSCHTGNIACGNCRGCLKHQETLWELGIK